MSHVPPGGRARSLLVGEVVHVMPKLETAEDAILAAEQFLRKYFPNLHPVKVSLEESAWRLEFDVSMVGSRYAHLSLDAESGKVITYEIKQ